MKCKQRRLTCQTSRQRCGHRPPVWSPSPSHTSASDSFRLAEFLPLVSLVFGAATSLKNPRTPGTCPEESLSGDEISPQNRRDIANGTRSNPMASSRPWFQEHSQSLAKCRPPVLRTSLPLLEN